MKIEIPIKVDGTLHTHVWIEFMENIKLTENKYWYEIYRPGKGNTIGEGEIVHDDMNGIGSLFKAVIEKNS